MGGIVSNDSKKMITYHHFVKMADPSCESSESGGPTS